MEHLTLREAAQLLRVSVPTAKRYIYEGLIRSVKLPGGQHRVPRSEVGRLLASGDTSGAVTASEAALAEQPLAERVATLEAELERMSAALAVVSAFCARGCECPPQERALPAAGPEHRLLVLGPGCRRCDDLFGMVERIVARHKKPVHLDRVKDVTEIASFGPVLTPALVLDDKIVVSGRVPSESRLRALIQQGVN